MGRIADAEESRPRPALKAVDRHRQDAHIFPVAHFFQAAAQEGLKPADLLAKQWQAPFADAVSLALGDNKGSLPVCITVEQDQNPTAIDMAEGLSVIVGAAA